MEEKFPPAARAIPRVPASFPSPQPGESREAALAQTHHFPVP